MRLVFLYVQDKASPGSDWNPKKKANNFYSNRVLEEGYYYLLKRLVEEKIVDEAVVFIESGVGQGYIKYGSGISGWVIPDIETLPSLLTENDIIFVRGGFKRWYETLVRIRDSNYWMLLYAANTGRERWPIWDVIFNDLNGDNEMDPRNTLQFDFKKPINPNIFYPMNAEPEFDLVLGASHIHDKKGQWRTIEALIEYQNIFGEQLKCIMPGAFRRSTNTLKMIEKLNRRVVDVELPGMVSRPKLNKIYNRSKFFIHLGGGGQGDRGPLEAMRCGTPVIVGNTTRHSKTIYQNKRISMVIPTNATSEEIARKLYCKIKTYNDRLCKEVSNYFEEVNGIETVILPEMAKLFNIFKEHPRRNMEVLKKEYSNDK